MRFRKGDRVYNKNTPQFKGTVIKGNYLGYGALHVQLDSVKTICYDIKDVVKITKKTDEIINKDIKCCPYCGSEEYVIKQRFSGTCNYGMRFDGEEADNGEMWEDSQFTRTSKYAWCRECGKRLFKLD